MKKSNLTIRAVTDFKLSTLREEDKSVEFVLSTENPAKVADFERWEIIDEVLIASGVQIPENGKIPLQDSHSRETVLDNLGHVEDIRVENNQVIGRLYFDKNDEKAVKAFNKVRDGHIDSGSVGYNVTEKQRVAKDEKFNFNGKEFIGPLQISTKWALKEYSLVAVGADPFAKARSDENIIKEKNIMPVENQVVPENNVLIEAQKRAEDLEKKALESLKIAERKMIDASIIELCARHGLQGESKKLIEAGASFEDAQRTVIEALAAKTERTVVPSTATIAMGETDGEKKRNEVTEGLMLRGFGDLGERKNNYAGKTLLEIGAECLERQGVNTRNMSRAELARKIIMNARTAVATDMTTASFSNITENAVNKAMMKGFNAQAHVWNSICSIGSVPDFKAASRVGLSENADLPLKLEGAEYRESKFSDRKESGTVATYADKTTLTEEALINDDIGVLMTIPFRKGAAAMRVPETLLFAKINTPPTLNATSKAWFDTTNATNNDMNQADGLNATNLADAIAQMKQVQAPIHSSESITDYLDIMPRVLLVHPDYEMTARILTGSAALPQSSMSSGVLNPLSEANLITKASARLTSSTSFYLFSDPQLYPVAEMLFLNGRVAPESFLDESTNIDGMTFRIRMRCGIIILEWRTALRFRKA